MSVSFLFYDLPSIDLVHKLSHQAATHLVAKLELHQREANHKIKMIRQQHRRMSNKEADKVHTVDFSCVPDVDDEKTADDLRVELAVLENVQREENNRLGLLLTGCGRGGGKSPEFEFAARAILATGCSAVAAKDNLLVGARLFLTPNKYETFVHEVPPNERD